jgi:sugar phosphate isomerase/epimerase
MIITLHGLSTMYCNIKTELRLAKECGFDGIEFLESKILRYLDAGRDLKEVKDLLLETGIQPVCINALKHVEVQSSVERRCMLEQCKTLSWAAQKLGCPTIQLVPLCSLDGRKLNEILQLTALNIKEIAKIGQEYNVRYQIEPIAFSGIHSLKASLELIDLVSEPNVGMVIDFWHLWAGRETQPDDVAALNKDIIYGVHFCDGRRPELSEPWDEEKLRSYLPGDGDIDVQKWTNAVLQTGYTGSWSSELFSPYYWEEDLWEIAIKTREKMEKYIFL